MILVTLATASKEDLKRRANKERMLLYEVCWCRGEEGATREPFTPPTPPTVACFTVVATLVVPWTPLKQVP